MPAQTQLILERMLAVLCLLSCRLGEAQGQLQPSSGRHLLQQPPTTTVFIGNLSAFDEGAFDCTADSTRCPVGVATRIPEYSLDTPANVTEGSSALYGSYALTGPQVQEVFDLLDQQLVRFA